MKKISFTTSWLCRLTTCVAIMTPLIDRAVAQDMLDYGKAHFFAGEGTGNRVYISISSRIVFADKEYMLLKPHPREFTFLDDGAIYKEMIARSRGASFVTFMLPRDATGSVIIRRFETSGLGEDSLRQCIQEPLWSGSGTLPTPPATIAKPLFPLHGDDVIKAAEAGARILAQAHYKVDGKPVMVEFPVPVLNINGDPDAPSRKRWQAASPRVPVYLGGDACSGLHEGYLAFGATDGPLQFVYDCIDQTEGAQDFSCTANFGGRIDLFAEVDESSSELSSRH